MQKRTREIVALVLLAVLGIAAVCAMGWYILAGHGWNVTASNIDDSIGQMDGYTVFLVEGTREREAVSSQDAEASAQAGSSEAAPIASESATGMAAEPQALEATEPADMTASSNATEAANATESASVTEQPKEQIKEPAKQAEQLEPAVTEADLEAISLNYEEKGAQVFCLKLMTPGLYEGFQVFSRKGERIGVYTVDEPARPAEARLCEKLLQRQKADLCIGITNDPALKRAVLPRTAILIDDVRDQAPTDAGYYGSVYCVDTPYKGEVTAIIVSPSGVISSKTIHSL